MASFVSKAFAVTRLMVALGISLGCAHVVAAVMHRHLIPTTATQVLVQVAAVVLTWVAALTGLAAVKHLTRPATSRRRR